MVLIARIIVKSDSFGKTESLSYQYFSFSLKMKILMNRKNILLSKSDLCFTKKLSY